MTTLLKNSEIKTAVSSSKIDKILSSISGPRIEGKESEELSNMFTERVRLLSVSDALFHNHSIKLDKYSDLHKVAFEKGKLFNKKSYLDTPAITYYKKTQRWQGTITRVEEDYFEARLADITQGGTDEIAEFYIDEISPSDRKLVLLGAVFYWTVGYKYTNGQITKESLIRLQRLPKITAEELGRIADNANKLHNSVAWD